MTKETGGDKTKPNQTNPPEKLLGTPALWQMETIRKVQAKMQAEYKCSDFNSVMLID